MCLEFKKINQIAWLMIIILIISNIGISNYSVEAQVTKQSTALTPHAPILINSSSDFTPTNGVSGGDGSPENPWIIEDLFINSSMYVNTDGGVGRFCIFIQYISDYFIIRNCHIYNYSAICGIYSFNVSNCIVENNIIENNWGSGIVFQHSNNVKIMNNTIKDHRDSGMYLLYSSEIVISNNTFMSNQDADISSLSNTNVTLTGNDFDIGISIDGAEPYIPGNPPTPSNQIYVWIAIIVVLVVSIFLLVFNMRQNRSNK